MDAKEWLKANKIKNTFIQVGDRMTQDLSLLMDEFAKEYHQRIFNRCATKQVSNNKHCPEKAKHQIGDSNDYLCDRCYENYLERNN